MPEAIKQRNLLNVPFEVRDILTDCRDVTFRRPPGAKVRLARRVAELMVDDMQLFTVDIGIEKQEGGDKTHELRLHKQNTTS